MVDRFFFRQPTNFKLPDTEGSILLLSGPPSSGKTSLLFQFAFNSAAENNGAAVVILCRRRRLQMNPPFLSKEIDPSSEVFQRIQMKYVDDDDGIKNYFAAFHLHDKMPKLVVIDDFADFFDERKCQVRHNSPRGRDLAMARVLSLCRNAIDHANKRGSCELLLSDTHKGDSSKLLYIYKRWVSHIYTIKESEGSGTYILKTQHHSDTTDKKTESAKYSISLQYLELEGLNEGSEG